MVDAPKNAASLSVDNDPIRFFLLGLFGTGKTTQFLSLPGKKFMYVFDPNALSALAGHDVDYESFLVDVSDVDMAVKSLSKGLGDSAYRDADPQTYLNWEKHFDEHWEADFFQQYDWIGFDSITQFLMLIMDRVLYINKRLGKQPERDDWSAQVNTASNVFRVLASLNKGMFLTGHVDLRQDDVSKKIYHRPMITGVLKQRLPILFNNIFMMHAAAEPGKATLYEAQTRPDKEFPTVRCSLKGLEMFEDVSIEDFNNPEEYGLGALLKKAGKVSAKPAAVSARKRK